MKYVIGIDEAGRGPLAGPVTVGAFVADEKIRKWIIKNLFDGRLRDSKKLSEKNREIIYKKFLILKKQNKINFSVSHISNEIIDKIGISKAVKIGIKNSLKKLHHTSQNSKGTFDIRLDGLLEVPAEFKSFSYKAKTIIKGDEKDVFIACASIVAKISRDKLMCKLAKKYPEYSFEIHKGYGTKLHIEKIKKYGLSFIHRKTFCKSIIKKN